MKTIVIAAGYATRLYPLTENFPKPLLEIGKSTILDRMLDDLDTIPDITEHIVVSNGKFAPIFEAWARKRLGGSTSPETSLRDPSHKWAPPSYDAEGGTVSGEVLPPSLEADQRPRTPVRVLNDKTYTNETRLGAVRDLILAIESFGIDEDILVVAADNILDFSFKGFVEFAKEKGTSCIMCHEQPSIEKLQRTGVVELDENDKVVGMEEKPQVPKTHWAVPPFYIYRREDLELIKHAIENGCGFDAPGNLAHYLVEHTTLHAWKMPAGRFDIGSLDTYEEAKRKYSI